MIPRGKGQTAQDSAFAFRRGIAPKTATVSAEEVAKWEGYLERRGVTIMRGEDALLDSLGCEALYADKKLFLRTDPSRSAFFEESFHAIQDIRGVPSKMQYNGLEIDRWEFEAQRSLIRNRQRLGIPNDQTRQTIDNLRRVYDAKYNN
jgi:hypothetical protein